MHEPLPITVVVPAYNAATYIAAALESVRRQTVAPLELIVVDDGSTDDTAAIARSFGARVISIANGGQASARNIGIRASSTPWIAFLDADDIWRTHRLERQWQALEASPGPLVVATDYAYLVDGRIVVEAVFPTFADYCAMPRRTVGESVSLAGGSDICRAIVGGFFFAPSTLLVNRRIFSDFDEYFCAREALPDGGVEFSIGEDYEWFLRLLRHTDVLFIETPLVDYRRTPSSSSANGGRLKHGDVVLGELICASPERYVAGASEAFALARPGQLFEAGIRYLGDGDVVRARSMFTRASDVGHRRATVFAAATFPFAVAPLGRGLFATIFHIWRTCVRPLVRGGSSYAAR